MSTKNEDYELIGRWLDGEDIDLTADQRALAEDITADAERVGPALDVHMPAGTLHRVNARLIQACDGAGRPHKSGRLVWLRWSAAAAAVAAAVIIAAVLFQPTAPVGPDTPDRPIAGMGANDEMFVYNILDDEDGWDVRAETLGEEMTDCRASLALNEDFPAALALAEMEYELEEFILDDAESDTSFDLNGNDNWSNGSS